MKADTIIQLVGATKGLGLSICDIARIINWDELAEIAKKTTNKIDDAVIATARTVLGVICKG